VEYLGEEVGNLIDPSATPTSNKQQHAFIVSLEQAADAELGGPYDEAKGEDGPSWSALMDHEYPLSPSGARAQLRKKYPVVHKSCTGSRTAVAGDGPGNWGEGRMAQQAPADIEHDFAGDLTTNMPIVVSSSRR
jgi:hypothetical protein